MWFLLLLLCTAHNQPLMVQGEDRTILLNGGSNPCEGYIGIYHNSTLGYVGGTNWIKNNDKVVCKSINCGDSNESSSNPTPGAVDRVWINKVNCKGDERNLWDCAFPGWASGKGAPMDCLRTIKCSYNIKIKLDGFDCAGAVQYSTDGGQTHSGYFCDTNWGADEADHLCKSLNCGKSKEIVKQQWMGWEGFEGKSKMKINPSCITSVSHLWQCAQPETTCSKPASVICTGHKRLQLKGNISNVCSGWLQKEENGNWEPVRNNETDPKDWCKQMHCGSSVSHNQDVKGSHLTCSENVKVVLINNEYTRCYGSVHVEVNGEPQAVCASAWNDEAAKVVCLELNCGSVYSNTQRANTHGIMDYVVCSGKEASLWHCRAKRDDNNMPFSCPSIAYVVCADSIGVRLRDGPGRCAGRVELQHEGTWRRVYKEEGGQADIISDIVCGQLNCGENRKSNREIFSQGSGGITAYTVKCKTNAKGISDCEIQTNKHTGKAMAITCEEHKVVFLNGSCSGMVGIEQGDKINWLSGSNATWNQASANTVCQQMHCGNTGLLNTSIPSADMIIWDESYSCSSNNESLFNCEKIKTLPSDHNLTIATVKCSGNITVKLEAGCWGNVEVCLNDKCGGVCADSWTDQQSEMLCKDMRCGEVLKAFIGPKESQVMFKSVHSTKHTTKLNECNFVRSDENDKTCKPAYVVCSGSIEPRLNDPRDKCSGNVEVHYEGKWVPVCTGALEDNNTKNTICEKLNCGKAVKQIEYIGPEPTERHSISQIQCSAHKSFGECTISPNDKSCKPGGLQCSEWRKMALAKGEACSGAAMVHSEGKKSAIAFEGWTGTMGEKLCKRLECGRLNKNYTKTTFWSFGNTSFSCADPSKTIWDCEKEVPPSAESQSEQQLFIECQDEPDVTLSNECSGNVKINDKEVCASNWKETYSHMLCIKRNCSNAFAKSSHDKQASRGKADYYHVSCEDNHYQLGQCKRILGKCDGKLVSVYCVGKVEFKTTEKCGGQIQVKYREKWEKVCPLTSFSKAQFDRLCEELGFECGRHKVMESKYNEMVDLETSLSCTADNFDIKHCLSHQSCKGKKPAEIYCEGYVPPIIEQTDPPKTSIWPLILGVGFALVLVILIVVVIRICVVKKAKNGSKDLPGVLSRKEVEIESGSYDDVMSKSNEMEELNPGRLRSESEVVVENDARSTSSFPYDDIDDPAAAQPLIPRASTAGASGGDCIQNGATYEVDDRQENYDDIEASPEIIRTEAEVHDNTQSTPESDAAAPQGSVRGDEDDLVPRRVSQN